MYNQVIESIEKEKIIVIVRGVAREDLIPLASALYEGGIRFVECTYDAGGKIPDEEIAERSALLAKHFEGKMLIGAGTVLRKNQIELTKAAGGKFIISPDTNEEIIAETKKQGLVSIPGALTPSEATLANRAGADFVKLFPINKMGEGYLKTICAPLSHIRFLAVGGVRIENILEHLNNGASGVGIGLSEQDRQAINQKDFNSITARFREIVNKIQ